MTERERMAQLVDEADRLASLKDGTHDMRHACAVVRGYAELMDELNPPWDKLEGLLAGMRICARSGFFPKTAMAL